MQVKVLIGIENTTLAHNLSVVQFAANVVKVIDKRANAAVNRIRIPAFFELDAVRFDRSGREEVFYVEV